MANFDYDLTLKKNLGYELFTICYVHAGRQADRQAGRQTV